jgi:hypothetical protein
VLLFSSFYRLPRRLPLKDEPSRSYRRRTVSVIDRKGCHILQIGIGLSCHDEGDDVVSYSLIFAVFVSLVGYVPDGMSPEEYRKLRQKEQDKVKNKRFGAFGPQTFKSRSMQAFQKDLEEGKGGHLMPVFNAKEKLKSGKIKKEDIPYMQRLGAWDNSDVQNAKKKQWRGSDKKYNQNADQGGIGWSGNTPVRGPQSISKSEQKTPKKKFFGLF